MFRNVSKLAPIIFTALATGINSNPAQAQGKTNDLMQQIEAYGQEKNGRSMGQVTNVNQLKDVSPTDWAYEALRSLVDRYGCIAGFPNQTYRGDQPLTRYEFAAGLNSCLNQIERLIASQESVGQEDIEAIQRLSQEFEAELAAVSGRIDELESRTALVEDNQFSTTT
ncbi:MAG: iron uptake porin, partial [Cyanobacteria bacterium J06642_3]